MIQERSFIPFMFVDGVRIDLMPSEIPGWNIREMIAYVFPPLEEIGVYLDGLKN
jgi:hypothetical protein